jgi:hypothetical protein
VAPRAGASTRSADSTRDSTEGSHECRPKGATRTGHQTQRPTNCQVPVRFRRHRHRCRSDLPIRDQRTRISLIQIRLTRARPDEELRRDRIPRRRQRHEPSRALRPQQIEQPNQPSITNSHQIIAPTHAAPPKYVPIGHSGRRARYTARSSGNRCVAASCCAERMRAIRTSYAGRPVGYFSSRRRGRNAALVSPCTADRRGSLVARMPEASRPGWSRRLGIEKRCCSAVAPTQVSYQEQGRRGTDHAEPG